MTSRLLRPFLALATISVLPAVTACNHPPGAEGPPPSSPEVDVVATTSYSTTATEHSGEIAPKSVDRAIVRELDRLAAERAAVERAAVERAAAERAAAEREAVAARRAAERRAALERARGDAATRAPRETASAAEVALPADPAAPVPVDRFRAIPLERQPVERFREVSLLVPAGTRMEVEMEDSLSSQTSRVGDLFTARLIAPVSVDGYFALPLGALVEGHVEEVERARRVGGKARLLVVFDRLLLPDGDVPLTASLYEEARGEGKRDAATIGGATVAGAILGRAIGDRNRSRGGTIGALIGAAIGTGIAASRTGEPIELPAGTPLTLVLEEEVPVSVRVRMLEVG